MSLLCCDPTVNGQWLAQYSPQSRSGPEPSDPACGASVYSGVPPVGDLVHAMTRHQGKVVAAGSEAPVSLGPELSCSYPLLQNVANCCPRSLFISVLYTEAAFSLGMGKTLTFWGRALLLNRFFFLVSGHLKQDDIL